MNVRHFHISGAGEALSGRDFRLFVSGLFFSLNGIWLQRLALGWMTWELTHSGFWLGVVAFADLFPVLLIGPFGGVLADRYDRRRVLILAKSLQSLQALVLAMLTFFGLASIDKVATLALFNGFVVGTYQASREAIVPDLVKPQHLAPAIAFSSVISNLCRFIGPAVAGLVIAGASLSAAFAVASFGHVILVLALLVVKPAAGAKAQHGSVLVDVLDGFRYVFHHATMKRLLAIEFIVGLCVRPTIELLPGFAGAVFDRGATGLAILTSSVGFGAVAGGIWLTLRGDARGLLTVTLCGLVAAGGVIVAFAAVAWLWLGAMLMGALGAAMVIVSAGAQTLVQDAVANTMRGRVLSIWGLANRGVPAIGALVMGGVAEFSGFGPSVAGGGVLCIIAALLLFSGRR